MTTIDEERRPLRVEFIDEVYEVAAGDSLTFGRAADLIIDDNPFLHRVVGRFVHREGVWWLMNHGRRMHLELEADDGTRGSLAPLGQYSLTSARNSVRFSGGPSNYELICIPENPPAATEDEMIVTASTATVDFGLVPLSISQHMLLVSLSAPRLSGLDGVTSSRTAAASLGWPITKFNRQLDHLCVKLRRAGVRGLCGDAANRATDRRVALVDHALSAGLVSPGDLDLLWGRTSDGSVSA